MAGPLRVEPDVSSARWVQEALHEDGTVATLVPPIFDAYARILHPATLETPTGEVNEWSVPEYAGRAISWADAAELIDDRSGGQRWTAWQQRFGDDQHALRDGRRVLAPHLGDIPIGLLAELAAVLRDEHGDVEVLAGVWEGSGLDPTGSSLFFMVSDDEQMTAAERQELERTAQRRHREELISAVDPEVAAAMRRQQVLGLPRPQQARGHVLLRAQLEVFCNPAWEREAGLGWRADWPYQGRTPNALWPVEPAGAPAWFVATDMDLDITHVGGSGHLIGRLLGHPGIEAERVRPTDPIV
ncbi:hypothetical protein [Agrococcus sp. ProA11]|uniref:hypothetical protein n=1 Tax=Agrococcus chionoecetis TaxID=3153752 RepID=UPI003261BCA8